MRRVSSPSVAFNARVSGALAIGGNTREEARLECGNDECNRHDHVKPSDARCRPAAVDESAPRELFRRVVRSALNQTLHPIATMIEAFAIVGASLGAAHSSHEPSVLQTFPQLRDSALPPSLAAVRFRQTFRSL